MADYWLWNFRMLFIGGSAAWGGVSVSRFRDEDKVTAASETSFVWVSEWMASCGGTQPLIVFTFSLSVTFANPQTVSPHNILPVYPPCRRRHSLLLITSCTFTSSPSPPPPLPLRSISLPSRTSSAAVVYIHAAPAAALLKKPPTCRSSGSGNYRLDLHPALHPQKFQKCHEPFHR